MRRVEKKDRIAEIARPIDVLPLPYFRHILGLTDRGRRIQWVSSAPAVIDRSDAMKDKVAISHERSSHLQHFSFIKYPGRFGIYICGEDAAAHNSRDIGNRRRSPWRLRYCAHRNCHQNRMAPRVVGSLDHYTEHRRPRRAVAAPDAQRFSAVGPHSLV
jgi:hypothetical protein